MASHNTPLGDSIKIFTERETTEGHFLKYMFDYNSSNELRKKFSHFQVPQKIKNAVLYYLANNYPDIRIMATATAIFLDIKEVVPVLERKFQNKGNIMTKMEGKEKSKVRRGLGQTFDEMKNLSLALYFLTGQEKYKKFADFSKKE